MKSCLQVVEMMMTMTTRQKENDSSDDDLSKPMSSVHSPAYLDENHQYVNLHKLYMLHLIRAFLNHEQNTFRSCLLVGIINI